MSDSAGRIAKLYEFTTDPRNIFVVGDLHGDLPAYRQIVASWRAAEDAAIVFLGDYADRGPQGVEIIESLLELSKETGVVILKGNHEDYTPDGEPLFSPCDLISEAEEKRGGWATYFNQRLRPFFDGLPIAALLTGRLLFVHGGISSRIESPDSLRYPTPEIESDILWSDPADLTGEAVSRRGAGVEFGADVTERVLKNLGVAAVVRSHQPSLALERPRLFHSGRVAVVSATSVYGGRPHYLDIKVDELSEKPPGMEQLLSWTRYLDV